MIEINTMTAFMAEMDLDNIENLSLFSDMAQAESIAYMARAKGVTKGVGKGIGQRPRNFKSRRSDLSIEDRRRKLKELKAKSTCRKCGKKGHWVNDLECSRKAALMAATQDVSDS